MNLPAHEVTTVAAALGDILRDPDARARLEALALEIFGPGDRASGWFLRKLRREGVDGSLSSVLRERATGRVCGYMLVGPSRLQSNMVLGAGMGLSPDARGRGLGRALVAATVTRLGRAGFTRLELPAEATARPFYERLGFHAQAPRETWLTYGCARPSADERRAAPAGPWKCASAAVELAGWREEAWIRTPPPKSTVRAASAIAHFSREGRALLVQRLCVPEPVDPHVPAALDMLRSLGALGTPVLLYGVRPVSFITQHLRACCWSMAQRSFPMRRELHP
ncbi:MAG: GNAT family N-acetyltransferase [Myxococcales bacterium]|nr:GNAT family N-acetyltransferase [Myxococcales bacterium]